MSGINVRVDRDFDVFLSFNSKERDDARDLKEILERHHISVWFDEDQIRPGSEWKPRIQKGISRSGSYAIAVGRSALGPRQEEEIEAAAALCKSLSRPMIPCLLPGGQKPTGVDLFDDFSFVDFQNGFAQSEVKRLLWGIRGEDIARINPVTKPDAPPTRWVLIAGSGAGELPRSLVDLSRRLGREIARRGWGLVTGGWPGVDHLAASTFADHIKLTGGKLSVRLVQLMGNGSHPYFPAGRLVNIGDEMEAWQQSIYRADAIILMGGLGGTYQTGTMGLKANKAVFSLPNTRKPDGSHSDAYRFYYKLLEQWENQPLSKFISRERYEELSGGHSNLIIGSLADVIGEYFNCLATD
jgi:predicted Rossmann-fold nucleotide-binding protein